MEFIANTRVCYCWLGMPAGKSNVVRKYFLMMLMVSAIPNYISRTEYSKKIESEYALTNVGYGIFNFVATNLTYRICYRWRLGIKVS